MADIILFVGRLVPAWIQALIVWQDIPFHLMRAAAQHATEECSALNQSGAREACLRLMGRALNIFTIIAGVSGTLLVLIVTSPNTAFRLLNAVTLITLVGSSVKYFRDYPKEIRIEGVLRNSGMRWWGDNLLLVFSIITAFLSVVAAFVAEWSTTWQF